MLISKQDIKNYVQFTLNIENRIIDPNITDAQEYDLRPFVGDAMYLQLIEDFSAIILADWDIATGYLINDFVIYNNEVYKALAPSTGSQPDTTPADWELNELGTFYINYLKPYLVFKTFGRFLLWVGRNITQYGLREINEETSVAVTDEGRSALIKDIKGKASIWQSRVSNYLCNVHWTFDTVKYEIDTDIYKENPRKTFNIRAVGRKNIKPVYKTNNIGGLDGTC